MQSSQKISRGNKKFIRMQMITEALRLPTSDQDLDLLNVLGDPILRASLPREYMQAVSDLLSTQKISLRRLAKHLEMGSRRLRQIFAEAQVPIILKRGRFLTRNTPEIRARAREFRVTTKIQCGYKRVAMSIAEDRLHPPYHAVYEYLHPQPLAAHEPVNKHTHAFVAKYRDYIWHTDLHEINWTSPEKAEPFKVYMIAFLDDASRYIMYYELLSDKTVDSTAKALRHALAIWPAPHVITSDNGGEFIGDKFTTVMRFHCIVAWHTKPHTPQQNGKMERFWGTIETCRKGECNATQIERIIYEYNKHWIHSALQCTPAEARDHLEYWGDVDADPDINKNLLWGTWRPFE
jgi:transposase InsO family protein